VNSSAEDGLTPVDPELVLNFGMGVVWDGDKHEENQRKHGYRFESVADWLDRTVLPLNAEPPPTVWIEQPQRDDCEKRFRWLSVDWEGHVVDFVFIIRDGDLRIISYRRANDRELPLFWGHFDEAEVNDWLRRAYPN